MSQSPENHVREILKTVVGENPDREGLERTPARFLKSFQFLTSGYTENVEKIIGKGMFSETCNDMVLVKNIEVYSLCEHHLLPFYGKCHVAYIPQGKIIGLSKIPRIVNMFSRRLQVQERLVQQVAKCLQDVLQPQGVGVVMEAYHLCMMMRGVEKQEGLTITSSMQGCFLDLPTRQEFLSLIKKA